MRYVFDVKGFPSVEDALNRIDALEDLLAGINVPRFVVGLAITDGHLIIAFSDGTTQDAGVIGGGVTPDPVTIFNTDETSTLDESQVGGASVLFAGMDAIFDDANAVITDAQYQLADLSSRLYALEN